MSRDAAFLERVVAVFAPGANDKAYGDDVWPLIQEGAQELISLLQAVPPARILDLACGCASMTTALALKGFDLVGMDCTPASIEVAKIMSRQKGACVEWLCQDMRALSYESQFDFVCLRDVIFGIFEAPGEDLDLLRRISLALKPGGKCLFEVYNREFALQHGVEKTLFYDDSLNRFVRRGGDARGLSLRLYSPDEWQQMLSVNSLKIVKQDGWNWRNDPPPPPWRADYIVAQKTN